jgi:hypothetical protein
MKTIINYTTGGLGNRLRPLSSAYAISKATGRTFMQFWDSDVTNGSLAKFNELFENDIPILSADDLLNLKSVRLYSDYGIVARLASKYGLTTLKTMVDTGKASLTTRSQYGQAEDLEDNVILYCNNFFVNTNRDFCHEFLWSLKPIKEIQDKIDTEALELGLSKDIIGIHARGTDFNSDVTYYTFKMDDILRSNKEAKFFLSTDDAEYERIICGTYGDSVITRKRLHLEKVHEGAGWDYNFLITKEKSQDSVVDLYLLSKTNIQVYNPDSTFYEVANILSQNPNK